MLQPQTLRGRRILVVEDEWPVAAFIRDTLEDAGAVVVGLAADCRDACNVLEGAGVEAAVVDLHLGSSSGHVLAHLLEMRDIPYLIETGYAPEAIKAHPGVMILQKPFLGEDLVWAVSTLLDGRPVGQRAKALS